MLFNSVIFVTLFLPLSLAGWYLLQRLQNPIYAKLFLIGVSLWFYGYYNPWYLLILTGSLGLNYILSFCFENFSSKAVQKFLFIAGIFCNIGILFYFKYFNFFIDNCNFLLHTDIHIEKIALPLGISFFTFQQLSFIIDRYRKNAPHYNFADYACFVTYFPQLIAGPIVLHSEFLPQLKKRDNRYLNKELFFDGLCLFILGFAKKVLLADNFALLVTAEFNNVSNLDVPTTWLTIIFYTFQLYFDFSGYCDMTRGIGRMFGFELPQNFNSPYLATSVSDFWHRWHMTLSRFLTTYIYFPLGGNRKGKGIQCRNLLIVFLISGFWHGANWTFVVWGLLHGIAMIIEKLFPNFHFRNDWLRRICTTVFVLIAWVFFRSDNLPQAFLFLEKMFLGGNRHLFAGACNTFFMSEIYPVYKVLSMACPQLLNPLFILLTLGFLLLGVRFTYGPQAEQWITKWGKTKRGLFCLSFLFIWSFISLSQVSVFLYFNF